MKIIGLASAPGQPVTMAGTNAVTKQVPIGKADGAPHFSFRVFTLAPGGHTPYHSHPAEHANTVISGHGCLVTESGEPRPLAAGDFALVLPGETHQYRNTAADQPFVMICAVPLEYE
jgi:quercetin dioxygenase-like cupin family protein